MIMTAAIDKISQRLRREPDARVLAYFFCQQQEPRLNNAVAVIKGLVFSLISQHGSFMDCLEDIDRAREEQEYGDRSSFWTLRTTFKNMLERVSLSRVYLLIDALDECTSGRDDILRVITRFGLEHKVRWVVTSQNEPQIKEYLEYKAVHTSLEDHSTQVVAAVNGFIEFKVQELSQRKRYSSAWKEEVREHLLENAQGTFLWVALVCRELDEVRARYVKEKLGSFPPGLEPLYDRMLAQVNDQSKKEDAELCRRILRFVAVAITLQRLGALPQLCAFPNGMHDDLQNTEELVVRCGSFLNILHDTVHFIHQSSADFFINGPGGRVFPRGYHDEHSRVAEKCLQWIKRTLKGDICNINDSGILCKEIETSQIYRYIPACVRYAWHPSHESYVIT